MPIKVKVNRWHAVAIWKWKVKEEDCGICRQPFDGTCPDCSMPGDQCPPVWGRCDHHFHMHCIMKWLQQGRSQDRCPLCRQPWEIKGADDDMSEEPRRLRLRPRQHQEFNPSLASAGIFDPSMPLFPDQRQLQANPSAQPRTQSM